MTKLLQILNRAFAWPLLALIGIYRICLSPIMPPSCRFEPSCSAYSAQALKTFGIFKGSALMVKRLIRCRPGGSFGFDPVPGCSHESYSNTTEPNSGDESRCDKVCVS